MAIELSEDEGVIRDGERYGIGDKVYSKGKAKFGVGYIQEIEVLGVHFGFRALIDSKILDEPQWYDSRNLTHEMPSWAKDVQAESVSG